MTGISAAAVKELRERTGAGMMDCKRALVDAKGDLDLASDLLRKAGQAKADKKATRIAAEGLIVTASGAGRHAIVEVNSETDFVAKDENFRAFAHAVAAAIVESDPADIAALMSIERDGRTLEEARLALVTKIGENIGVRRFEVFRSAAVVGSYVHMGRIGVLVEVEGGDEVLARDLAMHIAAAAPRCVAHSDIPPAEVAKEREIIAAQAQSVGKPADIVARIIEGKLKKHLDQVTLLGQEFVKNPDQRVRDLLAASDARVQRFVRYEVGEGIEKKTEDFAAEVMAQASRSR
jgi:elongation factor Ts